jgi:hypothetical protein
MLEVENIKPNSSGGIISAEQKYPQKRSSPTSVSHDILEKLQREQPTRPPTDVQKEILLSKPMQPNNSFASPRRCCYCMALEGWICKEQILNYLKPARRKAIL